MRYELELYDDLKLGRHWGCDPVVFRGRPLDRRDRSIAIRLANMEVSITNARMKSRRKR